MKLALCWHTIVKGSVTGNIHPRAFNKVGLVTYQSWETFFKYGHLSRHTSIPKSACRDGRAEVTLEGAVIWHKCNTSNWLLVFGSCSCGSRGGAIAMGIGAYNIALNKRYSCCLLFWYRQKKKVNGWIRHSDKKCADWLSVTSMQDSLFGAVGYNMVRATVANTWYSYSSPDIRSVSRCLGALDN